MCTLRYKQTSMCICIWRSKSISFFSVSLRRVPSQETVSLYLRSPSDFGETREEKRVRNEYRNYTEPNSRARKTENKQPRGGIKTRKRAQAFTLQGSLKLMRKRKKKKNALIQNSYQKRMEKKKRPITFDPFATEKSSSCAREREKRTRKFIDRHFSTQFLRENYSSCPSCISLGV